MKIVIFIGIFLEVLTINGFITRTKLPKFNTNLYMIWAYPLFDDSPNRGPRRKIHQAFERGPVRANVTLNYEYANRLAQNTFHVPGQGELPYRTEEGLGDTEDIHTSPETACGGIDIDPAEFDKIKTVYKVFNDRNCGVLRIIGAKLGHFSFLYYGPIRHKYGIKCYLRYLINRVYPGAKVTILTQESHDRHRLQEGVNPGLFGKQQRLMITGRDYCESFKDGLPNENALPPKVDMII
uniref:Uncharacterized protein n=1 Tax=Theileria annulata TaxID=5874 RepID=A0A3B0MHR3_THEAN